MECPQGKLFEDQLLQQIRDRFCQVDSDPLSGKRIYLENAGGSLTLKHVVAAVAEQTALPDNAGRRFPRRRVRCLPAGLRHGMGPADGAPAGNAGAGQARCKYLGDHHGTSI